MGWELLQHPPYSPDLAPSDFHLFGPLKDLLGGIKFGSDEDVQQHVLKFLRVANKDFYATGFSRLEERWERCVELQGNYIENNITIRFVRFIVVLLGLLVLELIERPSYINQFCLWQ